MSWYRIRPMREDDVSFVLSSWLNHYAGEHPAHRQATQSYLSRTNTRMRKALKHAYYADHAPRVREWVRSGAVLVAALEADDGVIVGWVCGEHNVSCDVTALHYVYTKSAYRKEGVARALVAALLAELGSRDVVFTHLTKMWAVVNARPGRRWPHVPWLAFGDYDATEAG